MTRTLNKVTIALGACLAFILGALLAFSATAYADEADRNDVGKLNDAYTYTITLSAGDGTIDGQSMIVLNNRALGEQVNLDYSKVVPNDSRYYVKGIRLAGRDNAELAESIFNVEGDAQYVVAYGLKKDQVAYTINFVDEAGNQLADSATYYGNVGDKPVVAFRYIDNYLPNAYNLTGTLSANEGENVFTFVYRSAPGVTYTTVVAEGEAAGTEEDVAAAVAEAAEAGEIIGDDGNPLAAPEELVDIDDNDNPLASGISSLESESGALNPVAVVGVVAGLLVVIALVTVLLVRRKKNQAAQQ